MRALGPALHIDGSEGLTREQADSALRDAIVASRARPQIEQAIDIAEAGQRYLTNREMLGLKPGTLSDYESHLRCHLVPFFGKRPLDEIDVDLVEAFIAAKRGEGKAIKSIRNFLGLLHAIFALALKREWCGTNPVAAVDKPRNPHNHDIRYLNGDELELLLQATTDDELGRLERTLYLTAAMTGLRRGELLALRWQDVDWESGVVRVRRTFSRGQFGTPKSRRSSRAVPLAARVIAALKEHKQRSRFQEDIDLVFAHPQIGQVLDPSKVRKRFQATARRAGLRPVRFHDLRHTFGTRMAAAGAPLRAIQEWMGHSDQRTTLIYADYAPDLTQGAMWAARAFTPAGGCEGPTAGLGGGRSEDEALGAPAPSREPRERAGRRETERRYDPAVAAGELQTWVQTDRPRERRRIQQIESLAREVITVFRASFLDKTSAWPYELVEGEARVPPEQPSFSTTAMITFALSLAGGRIEASSLAPSAPLIRGFGMAQPDLDPEKPGTAQLQPADTLVGAALEQLVKDSEQLTHDAVANGMKTAQAPLTSSGTFGADDPFTLTWLLEALRGRR
jgi:integrase